MDALAVATADGGCEGKITFDQSTSGCVYELAGQYALNTAGPPLLVIGGQPYLNLSARFIRG
jgi:hypothetical protein